MHLFVVLPMGDRRVCRFRRPLSIRFPLGDSPKHAFPSRQATHTAAGHIAVISDSLLSSADLLCIFKLDVRWVFVWPCRGPNRCETEPAETQTTSSRRKGKIANVKRAAGLAAPG